jgi:hypothetical protein
VATIVEEFFASGDVDNVATSLEDLEETDLLHYFVKRLLVLALDRKDKEREMASMLLSNLYSEVSSDRHIGLQWQVQLEPTYRSVPPPPRPQYS